ncbi:MAG TPA: AAA-like domain-containing protein [Thermoanaerobaculia bacterium]|jgi:hypothetical protein|nr:AAA-like domain-containing protein [Thermoanaerobaculia bacterium]
MTKIFISYRHIQPDEDLAATLTKYLKERGAEVFVDQGIRIGTRWAAEIDRNIRASSAFIVLVSEGATRSDMVREEIRLAHHLGQQGNLVILPIRIAFEADLPYDIGAYLNPLQSILWRPSETFLLVCDRVWDALNRKFNSETDKRSPELNTKSSLPSRDDRMPLPVADLRLGAETAAVRLNSPFYIKRAVDEATEAALHYEGATIILRGPRQIGKSSLLVRLHASIDKDDQRSVYLDFQSLDEKHLRSLRSLLRNMAARISRSLRLAIKPSDIWDNDLGEKTSFMMFLEAVLHEVGAPLLLCIDEVDRVFDYPYKDDFFYAVRSWQSQHSTSPAWNQLSLVIAHATDPALWIENLSNSPFNVGLRLHVEDFTLYEAGELNTKYGSPLTDQGELYTLWRLVGGQPYLLRQALYDIQSNRHTLNELSASAADDRGPFGDHLRRHLWVLCQNPRLLKSLKQILHRSSCENEMDFQRLLAAGLVRGHDRREASLRCNLYYDYFRRHI